MNKIFLTGNTTKDPESGTTSSGVPYCKFTIAVNRKFEKDKTDFINIVTWRGIAETCAKYVKKGRKLGVVGSLQIDSYESKDGTKRNVVQVVADEVEFLSSGASENTQDKPQERKSGKKSSVLPADEVPDPNDLPF